MPLPHFGRRVERGRHEVAQNGGVVHDGRAAEVDELDIEGVVVHEQDVLGFLRGGKEKRVAKLREGRRWTDPQDVWKERFTKENFFSFWTVGLAKDHLRELREE